MSTWRWQDDPRQGNESPQGSSNPWDISDPYQQTPSPPPMGTAWAEPSTAATTPDPRGYDQPYGYSSYSSGSHIDPYASPPPTSHASGFSPYQTYAPSGYRPSSRASEQGTTAMVLGIVAFMFPILGPVALIMGLNARKAAVANPHTGSDSNASAAIVLGAISTGLMVISILGVITMMIMGLAF